MFGFFFFFWFVIFRFQGVLFVILLFLPHVDVKNCITIIRPLYERSWLLFCNFGRLALCAVFVLWAVRLMFCEMGDGAVVFDAMGVDCLAREFSVVLGWT